MKAFSLVVLLFTVVKGGTQICLIMHNFIMYVCKCSDAYIVNIFGEIIEWAMGIGQHRKKYEFGYYISDWGKPEQDLH